MVFEYVGFLSSFAILGAVGFRYGVLRSSGGGGAVDPGTEAFRRAAAGGAGIGFVGVVLGVVSLVESLLGRAEAKHLTFGGAFAAGGATTAAEAALLGVLLVSFPLARGRIAGAWAVAGGAALALGLRNVLTGRIVTLVNPLHMMGASLWLGTLFVLVVSGLGEMLRPSVPGGAREAAVAEMVRRFSGLALGSAGLLAVTGVVTAWRHLNPFAALWSTPYGYALDAKLLVVAIVAGLGAWNWKRVGPALGGEGGALKIRRSASLELAFAAVVLALTALLVTLPSPKLPGH